MNESLTHIEHAFFVIKCFMYYSLYLCEKYKLFIHPISCLQNIIQIDVTFVHNFFYEINIRSNKEKNNYLTFGRNLKYEIRKFFKIRD